MSISQSEREQLLSVAERAAARSYSRYSGFAVGAAVLTAAGKIYGGANVENASYGATMCAERVAVFKAISEGAERIVALAVYAEKAMPYPCGMCLQVLSEFASPDIPVFLTSGAERRELTLKDLFPVPFELK